MIKALILPNKMVKPAMPVPSSEKALEALKAALTCVKAALVQVMVYRTLLSGLADAYSPIASAALFAMHGLDPKQDLSRSVRCQSQCQLLLEVASAIVCVCSELDVVNAEWNCKVRICTNECMSQVFCKGSLTACQ